MALSFLASPIWAEKIELPSELKKAQITENLGKSISVDKYLLRDEDGNEVRLSKYFKNKKPVALQFVYFECPSLCSFVLNGFNQSAKGMNLTIAKDFEVITVSIDPKEGQKWPSQKKRPI